MIHSSAIFLHLPSFSAPKQAAPRPQHGLYHPPSADNVSPTKSLAGSLKRSKKGITPVDPSIVESSWPEMVQQALGYDFEDPNLLEEALESKGSGVGNVGQGDKMRTFERGNQGLSRVGDMVNRLVQADLAYRARKSEGSYSLSTLSFLLNRKLSYYDQLMTQLTKPRNLSTSQTLYAWEKASVLIRSFARLCL